VATQQIATNAQAIRDGHGSSSRGGCFITPIADGSSIEVNRPDRRSKRITWHEALPAPDAPPPPELPPPPENPPPELSPELLLLPPLVTTIPPKDAVTVRLRSAAAFAYQGRERR
jgi:hypothetical protein